MSSCSGDYILLYGDLHWELHTSFTDNLDKLCAYCMVVV